MEITYKENVYEKVSSDLCKNCCFNANVVAPFGGCKCPDDFPEQFCEDGVIYKRN